MVGILRKIMQVLKTVRGPVLKFLTPLINSFAPGVGDMVATGANQIIDRSSNTLDAYDAAKAAGKRFRFSDGVKAFFAPSGAVSTKTKDYGGLHPRLELKEEET
jgi:hypothetical protein